MRKYYYSILCLCCFQSSSSAQPVNEGMTDNPGPFYKGYALPGVQGKDTLACSIAFDRKLESLAIPDMVGKIFLLIDSSMFRVLPADLEITGFGFEAKGKQHDYGLYFAYGQTPEKNRAYFIKIEVAGAIDLYKYDQVEELYNTWGPEVLKQTNRTIPNTTPVNKSRLGLKTHCSGNCLLSPDRFAISR